MPKWVKCLNRWANLLLRKEAWRDWLRYTYIPQSLRTWVARSASSWTPVEALEPRLLMSATISGMAFNDLDNDQTYDSGANPAEEGLAEFVVYVDADHSEDFSPGDPYAVTASGTGEYSIFISDSNFDYDEIYDIRVKTPTGFELPEPLQSFLIEDNHSPYTGINYAAPTPTLADFGPTTAKEGELATFRKIVNFGPGVTASSATPITGFIDWGDDSPPDAITLSNAGIMTRYHTFADTSQNPYEVTVTITNKWGGTRVQSYLVNVQDVLPVIEVTARTTNVEIGSPFTIDLWAHTPVTEKFSQWQVDWGDNGGVFEDFSGSVTSVSHTYEAYGNYTIIVKAKDNEDNAASAVVPLLDTRFGEHGRVVMALSPTKDDAARDVALLPDGKFLVAGYVNDWDAQTEAYNKNFALGRYNPDGTLDEKFGVDGWIITDISEAGADDEAYRVLVQPDGKILLAGYVNEPTNGGINFAVVRYKLDVEGNWVLDASFGDTGKTTLDFEGATDYAYSMALDLDSAGDLSGVVVVGTTSGSTFSDFAIARFRPDGTLDTSFGDNGKKVVDFDNGNDTGRNVVIQPDGRIVIVGMANGDYGLVRLMSNGSFDTDFDGNEGSSDGEDGQIALDIGGPDIAYDVALHEYEGELKIVVVGNSTTGHSGLGNSTDISIARFNADNGSLDENFGVYGIVTTNFEASNDNDSSKRVIVQPDGKIIVGGYTREYIEPYEYLDFALVRYDTDGELDPTFGTGGKLTTDFSPNDQVNSIVLQPNGKIVAVGHMGVPISTGALQLNVALARYLPANGAVVSPKAVDDVYEMIVSGPSFEFQANAASGVLVNDYDSTTQPLTAQLISGPEHDDAFTLNSDGSFDYTPISGFSGIDRFKYVAVGNGVNSKAVTVVLKVTTGDTQAPNVYVLNPLAVVQNGSRTITNEFLSSTGEGANNSKISYLVTAAPEFGQITRRGVSLGNGGIFTQGDIDNGFIVYHHSGEAKATDEFSFIARDIHDNPSAEFTFNIDVEVDTNRAPIFLTELNNNWNTSQIRTVYEDSAVLIRPEDLQVIDSDTSPQRLKYKLKADPLYGELRLYTGSTPNVLGVNDTFTQADINAGRLVYVHTHWLDLQSGAAPAAEAIVLSIYHSDENDQYQPFQLDTDPEEDMFYFRLDIVGVDRTLVVSTLDDQPVVGNAPNLTDGLSLREAIWVLTHQNRDPAILTANMDSVIVFDPSLIVGGGATMYLTYGELLYQSKGTGTGTYTDLIIGPGADWLTIDLEGKNRALHAKWADNIEQTLIIEGMTIANGYASGDGGAIHVESGYGSNDNKILIGDVVVADSRATGDGGGIHIGIFVNPELQNIILRDNIAGSDGGGAYIGGSVTIKDSWIEGNEATTGSGGGLYLLANAESDGSYGTGQVDLYSSSIVNNRAALDGGGIYVSDHQDVGSIGALNSLTISGNSAGRNGGGGYVYSTGFNHSTIVNNAAGVDNLEGGIGGGVYGLHIWGLTNSIIANNTATSFADLSVDDDSGSYANSLVGIWDYPIATNIPPIYGSSTAPFDPQLTELIYHPPAGRPLHLPLLGSPVIDRGDSSGDPSIAYYYYDVPVVARDGDGDDVATYDIGAAEYEIPDPDDVAYVRISGLDNDPDNDDPIVPNPASVYYLRVNSGHEEGNIGANGLPMPDSTPDQDAGHRITPTSDPDLKAASLKLDVKMGESWWLDYDPRLLVWWSPEEAVGEQEEWVILEDGKAQFAEADIDTTYDLYIEAIGVSEQTNDMSLYVYIGGQFPYYVPIAVQAIHFTASGVDLDIDSTNVRSYDSPRRDDIEEEHEVDSNGAKRVIINDSVNLVPVVLEALAGFDPYSATFRFTYDSSLKLWLTRDIDRVSDSVVSGGDYIPNGAEIAGQYLKHSDTSTGLTVIRPEITLWVEAIDADTSAQIWVEVDPDGPGGPGGFESVFSDFVQVSPSEPAASISGNVWNDKNGNGTRDEVVVGAIVQGEPTNIIYVIDRSGSTRRTPEVPNVPPPGDVNGDGDADSILDYEIAALIQTTRNIQKQLDSWAETSSSAITVSIVAISKDSQLLDLDPGESTEQYSVNLADGLSAQNTLVKALRSIKIKGGTDYESGLQETINAISIIDQGDDNNHLVLFLSDGKPNNQRYLDELATLKNFAAIRTFGVGKQVDIQGLQVLGPGFSPQKAGELITSTSSPIYEPIEPGLPNRKVYIDLNNNNALDTETIFGPEPIAITDPDGNYVLLLDAIDPDAEYIVRVVPEDRWVWRVTSPNNNSHDVKNTLLGDNEAQIAEIDFGLKLVSQTPDPSGDLPIIVDLDIDSDNNNGFDDPTRNLQEDELEDTDGYAKNIVPNDLLPTSIVLDLGSGGIDLSAGSDVRIQWVFSEALADDDGHIWIRESDNSSIHTGDYYTPAQLGFSETTTKVTFYIQGITPTADVSDSRIMVRLVDGENLDTEFHRDTVRVNVLPISQGTGSISGYVFHDRNQNGLWDVDLIKGEEPDIVFLVDMSSSTWEAFQGTFGMNDYDVHSPGRNGPNQISDAEIAGVEAMVQQLVRKGLGSTARVSVVLHDHKYKILDMDPTSSGVQYVTTAGQDRDGNGKLDVMDAFEKGSFEDGDNDFGKAYDGAIHVLQSIDSTRGNANIIFMSDGINNDAFANQLTTLRENWDANIRAFGIGAKADMTRIRMMDPAALRITAIEQLLSVFGGVGENAPVEEPFDGWEVYLDFNQNGQLDAADFSTHTDANGVFRFEGVPAGSQPVTLRVHKEPDDGWRLTGPSDHYEETTLVGQYTTTLSNEQVIEGINFGLVENFHWSHYPKVATATFTTEATTPKEGQTVTVTLTEITGYKGILGNESLYYSFDVNDDGDFFDPGDIYRSSSPSHSFSMDDDYDYDTNGLTNRYISVQIHDAAGNPIVDSVGVETPARFVIDIDVQNVAPTIHFLSAPTELDISKSPDNVSIPIGVWISDPGILDLQNGINYEWSITRDGQPLEIEDNPDNQGNGIATSQSPFWIRFAPSIKFQGVAGEYNQGVGGVYKITVTASDDDTSFSVPHEITVLNTIPWILEQPTATLSSDGRIVTLNVIAGDDASEDGLRYEWAPLFDPELAYPLNPQIKNASHSSSTFQLVLTEAREYQFEVRAIDANGVWRLAKTNKLIVASIPTTVRILGSPAEDGYTLNLTAQVRDQFDNPIAGLADDVVWTFTENMGGQQGVLNDQDDTATYTPPANLSADGTAIIKATYTFGQNDLERTFFAEYSPGLVHPEPVPSPYGIPATGITVVEGNVAGPDVLTPIASFIDPIEDDMEAGDYDIVFVGDETPIGYTDDDIVIVEDINVDNLFHVSITGLNYPNEGPRIFSLNISTNTSPIRTTTIDDIHVDVVSAPVHFTPAHPVVPMNSSSPIVFGTLHDENPNSSEFSVLIGIPEILGDVEVVDWYTGQVVEISANTYEIRGTVEFDQAGWQEVRLKFAEDTELFAETGFSIKVQSDSVAVPTGLSATLLSGNRVFVQWIGDSDVAGYILHAIDRTTGTTREITSPGSPFLIPNLYTNASGDPSLFFIDENLAPNSEIVYTIQAVKYVGADLVRSVESTPFALINESPLQFLTTRLVAGRDQALSTTDNLESGPALIALFTDITNPLAGVFSATIDWGDGSSSFATVTGSDGLYSVYADHTYSNLGSYVPLMTVKKNDLPFLNGGVIASVQPAVVTPPTEVQAEGVSSSQIFVKWRHSEAVNGYIVWATDTDGVTRRLPADTGKSISPKISYDENGAFYYYYHEGLKPDSSVTYTVQAVRNIGGYSVVSPLSNSDSGQTISVNISAPQDVSGRHVIADDPITKSSVEGIQLFWLGSSDVTGYRIFRRVSDPLYPQDEIWLDLITGDTLNFTQGATWLSALPEGESVPVDVIDPTSIFDNGHVGWFDIFDPKDVGNDFNFYDENYNQIYRYHVVAYAPSGIISTDAVESILIQVGRDSVPPSEPTGLAGNSYPQAIQLTWNDRPVSDDADWNGWNVYRWIDNSENPDPPNHTDPADERWVKLNLAPVTEDLGFNDRTAPVGETSHYMLRTVDFFGNESIPSFIDDVYRAKHSVPPAPTSAVGRSNGANSILLTWDPVTLVQDDNWSGDALLGYEIQRQDGVNWVERQGIDPNPQTQASFTDTGLLPEETYTYRIRTVDIDGDYSAWVQVQAQTGNGVAPAIPILGTGEDSPQALSPNAVKIVWTLGIGGDPTDHFVIYRAKTDKNNFIKLSETTDFTLTDTRLDTHTKYFYRIYAVDEHGDMSAALEIDDLITLDVPATTPYASITSHTGDNPIELITDTIVRGVVDDANNDSVTWKLLLRPFSQSDGLDIIVSEGSSEIGQQSAADGKLGTIRPTMLRDGLYRLVLQVTETIEGGQPVTRSTEGGLIQIRTEVKTGSLNLPFEDLVIDVPGGLPITITRVYDSAKAGELGDFGNGWKLQLTDTNLRTTARPGIFGANRNQSPALRDGDLVYFDVPGLGRQTFMFLGVPTAYDPLNPAAMAIILMAGAVSYTPAFIAVDGSGSRIEVQDPNGLFKTGQEYYAITDDNGQMGYNPANPGLGELYTLITRDGRQYTVHADTGTLDTSKDANGNVTNYNGDSVATDFARYTIQRDAHGLITSIFDGPVSAGIELKYTYTKTYDSNNTLVSARLASFQDASGQVTTFTYDDGARLETIADPRGVNVLKADYDLTTGQLVNLEDAGNNAAEVAYGAFDGHTGSNAVTDTLGNTTEQIYDQRGNVIREIVTLKDGVDIVGYKITVHEYNYSDEHGVDLYKFKASNLNTLKNEIHWQSFIIENDDPAGRRYFESPTVMLSEITYRLLDPLVDTNADSAKTNHDLWQPMTSSTLAPDGVTMLTTTYENYYLGKPGKITDPYGNVTLNYYDKAGNLRATTDPLGQTICFRYTGDLQNGVGAMPPNGGLINFSRFNWEPKSADPNTSDYDSTLQYRYFSDNDTPLYASYASLSAGLLLETYRVTNNGSVVVLNKNVYYDDHSDSRVRGLLKSTTDSSGVTTRYTYDNLGHVIDVFREWTDTAGSHSVLQSHTEYDAAGRVILTSDAQGNTTQTFYDRLGRTLVTIDAFGGKTFNTYDIRGQLIRTLSPDGFETRTAYDQLGRAIFQSEPFFSESEPAWTPGDLDITWTNDTTSTYIVTQTLYDPQGQVVGAKRFANAKIDLEVSPIQPTEGVLYDAQADLANAVEQYTTATEYDSLGRVIESTNPDGLRTATLYYTNGQVHYTGIITNSQIEPGQADDPTDFASYTEYRYDAWNPDAITLDAKLTAANKVPDGLYTITFLKHNRENPQSFVYNATNADIAQVLNDLVSQINAANLTAFADQFDAARQGNRITLAAAGSDAGYILEFATPTDARMSARSSTTPSTWIRDPNNHITLSVTGLKLFNTSGAVIATRDLTIFHDGSFTESIRGNIATLVTRSDLNIPDTLQSNFTGNLDNISHMLVRIAQRLPGDAPLATYELYDKSGRLSDIWLPADSTYPDIDGPHYHYTYDANGNQTLITDPLGRVTRMSYDDFGRQLSRTLPLGQTELNVYGTMPISSAADVVAGQLAYHVDFEGRVMRYVYDNSTGGRGRIVETQYYASLSDTVAQRTLTYAQTYDATGRTTIVTDSSAPADGITTSIYDPQGRLTRIKSPEGIINYVYDPLGRLTQTFTGSGETTGDPDFPNDPLVHWALDEATGDVVTNTGSAGSSADATLQGDATWNASGHDQGALDLDGSDDYFSTDFNLDPYQQSFTAAAWVKLDSYTNFILIRQLGGSGVARNWLSITATGKVSATLGNQTLTSSTLSVPTGDWTFVAVGYDTSTQTLKLYIGDQQSVSEAASDTRTTEHSTGGFQIGGRQSNNSLDGLLDDVRIYDYALTPAQLTALAAGSPTSGGDITTDTRYTYDQQGRLQTVTQVTRNSAPVPSDGTTVPWTNPDSGEVEQITGETTTYHYDAVGNLDWTQQSAGWISDYRYDGLNRLTELAHFVDADDDQTYDTGEALKGRFEYELSTDGQRTSSLETDHQGVQRSFTWEYDALNRLVEEVYDADGISEDYIHRYTYDFASNRTKLEKDNGNADAESFELDQLTTYIYDANDRLLTESSWHEFGDSAIVADAAGDNDLLAQEPTFSNDAVVGDHSLVFDGTNQSVNLSADTGDLTHAAFSTRTIAFHFKPDANGATVQTLYEEGGPDAGFAIRLIIDQNDDAFLNIRLDDGTQSSDLLYGGLDIPLIGDAFDWHHLAMVFTGTYTPNVYLDGALLEGLDQTGNPYIQEMAARTGDAGLGATIDGDVFGSGSGASNRFTGLIDDVRIYSDILTAEQIAKLQQGEELNTLNTPTLPIPVAHWSMEPVPAISPDNRTTIYGYGDNNNGTKQTTKTVYEGPDYTGNLGDLVEEHIYDYDASGRMTEVTIDKNGTAVVEEYGYNDQNLRISRSVTESGNTTVTQYLLDTNNLTGYSQILEEHVNDGLSKTYTIGSDVIAQYDDEHGVLTFLYDGHGSTRALVDASGEIVQQFAYEAYGTMIVSAELTAAAQAWTTIQYSGEHFNARTGLQNLRTRELDLATARFPTMDDPRFGRINNPISLNKYLYVHANPIMGIDPSGRSFNLVELIQNTTQFTLLTGSIGGISGAVVGKITGIGGLRGAYLGGVAGAALGFAISTKQLGPVLRSALLQGSLSLTIDIGVDLYDSKFDSNGSKLMDSFLSGFASGAASSAFTLGLQDRIGDLSIVGGGALAGFNSIISNTMNSISKGEWPDLGNIFTNAAVAFVLGVATNPSVLFSLNTAPADSVLSRAASGLTNIDDEKIVSAIVSAFTGGSIGFAVKNIEEHGHPF